MAKIAFFTEKLPPDSDPITGFGFELMKSLADQQHDVRVLTTYRDPALTSAAQPPYHPRLEILRPFQKWSWLEVPRVVPLMMEFRPDILHFIQPRAEAVEGFTNAMNALPGIAPLVGRPAIVTSLYDVRDRELDRYRILLFSSDAITVANEAQRRTLEHYLEGLKRSRRPRVELIPASTAAAPTDETAEDIEDKTISLAGPVDFATESLARFFSQHDRTIFVPGDIDAHETPARLFDNLAEVLSRFPRLGLVFGGGWGRITTLERRELMKRFEEKRLGARLLLTGPLDPKAERECLKRASVVFVASLPPESLALARYLRDSLAMAAAIVMEERQSEFDPLPWRDRTHAFIAPSAIEKAMSWGTTLAEALTRDELRDSVRRASRDFHREEVIDLPGNLMSRLYSQVLLDRTTRL